MSGVEGPSIEWMCAGILCRHASIFLNGRLAGRSI